MVVARPARIQDCSGHGSCANEQCECAPGWTGKHCALPEGATCSSEVVDARGKCCASGVLSKRGECCPEGGAAETTRDGECCAQGVDACGVCGGRGKAMDVRGQCCEVWATRAVSCDALTAPFLRPQVFSSAPISKAPTASLGDTLGFAGRVDARGRVLRKRRRR